jgi:polysaccharide export outer membrane protein
MLKPLCNLCVVAALVATSSPAPANQVAPQIEATDPAIPVRVGAGYVIGPGDVLQVFVWRNPELSVTVPVRPDGRITTPLVEEMVAAGKSAAQLARDIELKLAEYIRSPQVNVIVTTPRSLMSEVKAVGQVRTPQAVPFYEGMTVLDLILAVGGLTEFAAGNRAKLIRQQDGKTREIRIRIDDLLNNGKMERNVALRPGDVIVVPESFF